MSKKNGRSFNDKMIARTVLPVIYLWMASAGSVVAMGIYAPDVVLTNLDGFIALIAIIGGVAAPAFNTLMRMWESEQAAEVSEIPADFVHEREREVDQHQHTMVVEKHEAGVKVGGKS
jgi:hypothetical protein